MNIKNNLKKVPSKTKDIKKSRGFILNATDTFHELLLIFVAVIVIGGLLYSLFEADASFFEGAMWALVTAFTVGYGDTVPQTAAGRFVGVAIMSLTVFVFIPLITALMASKMMAGNNAVTNARLNMYLDEVESKKKKSKVKTVSSGKIHATRAK